MESITLQVGGSIISSGDALGQVQFAASAESDGGASRYIVGRIYGEAEGAFNAFSNPASIIFATSAADNLPASGKIKISHEGHILPLLDNTYDLGSPDLRFRDLYVTSEVTSPSGNFDSLFFNTTLADIDQVEGQLNWNDTLGTLDLGLTDTLTTHLGQDVFYRVINLSGGTIYKGQAVYAAGVNAGGQRIEIGKFVADGSIAEVRYIGLLAETLNQGDVGYVTHFGHVRKVDLRSSNTALNPNAETWAAGDILFPDSSTAGGLTKVPPQDTIYTAIVLTDGNNGELLVRITDPGHINDLHDVNTSGVADNNLLVWNSGADYWEPSSGLYYVDGDLGIGTSSPNATLHVYNSTPSGTVFNVEGTNGSLFSVVDNLSGVLMSVNNNAGLPVFEVYDDDSIIAGRFAQNDFVVSSGGNVGIGTDSPVTKLDVSGVITATGGDSDEWNQSYDWVAASGGLPYVTGVGTANQVAFFNDTDSITSESNLYWDSTNNRLGIGTSSPANLLELKRAGTGPQLKLTGTSASWDFYSYTDNALYINNSAGTSIGLLSNRNVYIDENLGIGTISPSYKLHVAGDISANANNIYGGGFAVYGDTNNKLTKSGNDFTLSAGQTTTDVHLGYYDGGTLNKVVTVDSSEDRVGILNTAPAYTLDVTGSGNFTGDVYTSGNIGIGTNSLSHNFVINKTGKEPDSAMKSSSGSSASMFNEGGSLPGLLIGMSSSNSYTHRGSVYMNRSRGTLDSPEAVQDGDWLGSYYGAGYDGSALRRMGGVIFVVDGTVSAGNVPTSIMFQTGSSSRTEKMRITHDGKLGIGTSSPAYTLDVNGDSNLGGNVIVGGNLTVNGTTISTNVDTIEIQDPIITLGLTSGNIVTDDSYDRGVAMVTNDGTAFMGWDNSEDRFVMLASGVATNGSGNYDAGIYGNLQIADLTASGATFDGNVGVGTASPSYDLHVDGNIATKAIKLYDSSYGTYDRNIVAAGNNITFQNAHAIAAFSVGVRGNRGTAVGMESNGTNGYLALAAGGSEKVRIATNGNVGIGDTTPSYKLDVAGTTAITPTAATETLILGRNTGYASVKSTASNELILDSDSAYVSLNHYSSDDVILGYGGGNVGIGTATPSYKLDVQSNITGGGNVVRSYNPSTGNGIVQAAFVAESNTSKLWTIAHGSGSTESRYGNSLASASEIVTGGTSPSSLIIGTQSNNIPIIFGTNGAERMRIAAGGNVGIGTTSPSHKLQVDNSASNEALRINHTQTGTYAAQYIDTVKYGLLIDSDSVSSSEYLMLLRSNGGTENVFYAGANGNIGIGTTTPVVKLEVQGAGSGSGIQDGLVRLRSTNASNPPGLMFINSGNTSTYNDLGNIQGVIESGNAIGGLRFITRNSDGNNTGVGERVRISAAGNVGIGTASPSNKLHVQGSSDQLRLSDGTLAFAVGYDNNYLRFKNSAGDTHTVINWSNGNVGIGTTSPLAKLHIQGSSYQQGLLIERTDTSSKWGLAGLSSGGFQIWDDNQGNATRFVINSSGDVGIGVDSPTTKLDVAGSGNFSGDVTIDGHLSAATKSFRIDHPTKEGKLQYGSLESPYHGVRLTGRGKIEGGKCVVELPDYISSLVRDDENVNIQLTNYRHGKTLYVDEINIANNEFTVKCDSWFGNNGHEFFWSFTAVRKDVQELQVEC